MKAFTTHCRAIPGFKATDAPSVLEIEGGQVLALEDPSVKWLPAGEFKFRITKPDFLYEAREIKQSDGSKKKEMVPTIYHSHAIYFSAQDALLAAKQMIREQFERTLIKKGVAYTEEQVEEKYKEIQEITL